MKFLTFTDLHEDKKTLKALVNRAKEEDIDFVVCCGDISSFGRGLTNVLASFNKIGKKFYVIPGNHEENLPWKDILKKYSNCIDLDRKVIKIEDYVFLGYGGGGFTLQDAEFRKISRQWYGKYNREKIVLLTHQPPYGTKLDKLEQGHVGNKDFTKFINRIKPKLAISGHLHETVGEIDQIEKSKLINPGWEGMVVELS